MTKAQYRPLMISAENAKAQADSRDRPPFVVANSMREVQPEINLLVSPIKENLIYVAPPARRSGSCRDGGRRRDRRRPNARR